ncbi:aldo/keto reductase [Hahella sp. SMD15-11]|uniref:Aldo/keto reductase n=1 Tax=Thermohahella caldifontis TaxID=3142973 RepID=A0AB39UVW6_9GAMM
MSALPLRPLGDTGLNVSPVGLGTVKIGRDQGVKYPTGFRIPDDQAVRELLALAADLGINVVDTAPAYGRSEERLGQLLTHRERWIIVTKVGEEFENGQSRFDFTPEHVRFSVERSLGRLRTDWLDMVLIHSDGQDLDALNRWGTLDCLLELKARGLIRAVGASTKTVAGGLATLEKGDVAMVTRHPGYDDETPVLDYAASHHKGILVKKALASGHLILRDDPDPVQTALDHAFAHPATGCVILGTINPAHLRENVEKAGRALARAGHADQP